MQTSTRTSYSVIYCAVTITSVCGQHASVRIFVTWPIIFKNDRWLAYYLVQQPGKPNPGIHTSAGMPRPGGATCRCSPTIPDSLPWVQVKCLASHLLSLSLKQLNQDWQDRYGHTISLVETFVDTTRFRGTCYRAANWIHVGQTQGRSRQDRYSNMKVPVKDIYLYPLRSDFRKKLCEHDLQIPQHTHVRTAGSFRHLQREPPMHCLPIQKLIHR